MSERKRVLSGIQPSGQLHIGNYFGAIRQFLELQEAGHDLFIFVANYHALTTTHDKALLEANTLHIVKGLVALGIDPDRTTLFVQSHVPEVCELSWFLSIVTPMGLLERAHSYKDKVAKGIAPNHGLFAYPVLMAADILAYDSHIVPVGRDQKQHVEITRDLAIKFNQTFGRDVFVLPDTYTVESTAVVPGIDGQKMSKSYDNTILVFDTDKRTKKRCGQIVTDSTPVEAPKNPDTCNVYALLKLFSTDVEMSEWATRYRAGGMGYGDAKQALSDRINAQFAAARARYAELDADPQAVQCIVRKGADQARAVAAETMRRVRDVTGIL